MLDAKVEQNKLLNLDNLLDDLKAIDDNELLPQAEYVLKQVISDSDCRVDFDDGYVDKINCLFLNKSVFFEYNIVQRTFKLVAKSLSELSTVNESVLVPVALKDRSSTTKKWTQILGDEDNPDVALHKIAKRALHLGQSRMKRIMSVFSKELLTDDFQHIRLTGKLQDLSELHESFALKSNVGYFSSKLFTNDEVQKIITFEWRYFSHFNWND